MDIFLLPLLVIAVYMLAYRWGHDDGIAKGRQQMLDHYEEDTGGE